MNMDTTIADARRRIEALDLSEQNARAAEIEQQLAQIEQALTAARARHEEVVVLLRPYRHDGGSLPRLSDDAGTSVADALLGGAAPSDAVSATADKAQLEHERDALKEGMSELIRRERALQDERRLLPSATGRRVVTELRPLCDLLEHEAREAALVIERSFAALSAIGRAANSNLPALQATGEAVAALHGPSGLLPGRNVIDVPQQITELLTLIQDKASAYRVSAPASIQVHDPRSAVDLAASMLRPRGPQQPARSYQ